jgi:hypothetical protein
MSIIPIAGPGTVLSTDPDATGAYIPPEDFTMSCSYVVLAENCEARILPSQINSLVSEMLALTVAFDPDGSFDCTSVENMADAFLAYRAGMEATVADLNSRLSVLEGSGIPSMYMAYSTGLTGAQNVVQDGNVRITSWLTPVISQGVTHAAGVFTVQSSGVWAISAYVNTPTNSVNETTGIYVNGVLAAANQGRSDVNRAHMQSAAVILPLVIGDQVEVRFNVSATSGGTFNMTTGRFAMAKLGEAPVAP